MVRRRLTVRLVACIAVVVLAAASTGVVVDGAPAAAQARLVNALVHTRPGRPVAGDDVAVTVSVAGCPRGDVTVEIYLTTSDGATRDATMITRAAAVTNLLFRTRAELRLPKALAGWYGARVLCGTFRPPKEAMANTLFAVGSTPLTTASLGAGTIDVGGTVAYSGSGCAGSQVEYEIAQGPYPTGAFEARGTLPVRADGSWSGELTVPDDLSPGSANVRSRCVASAPDGDIVYVYYRSTNEITVAAA